MKILQQLLERLKQTDVYKIKGRQHVAMDKLQHLDVVLDLLKQDSDMLLEWIDKEQAHVDFMASKYRAEEDVKMYTDRSHMLEMLRMHIHYFLSIK